MNLDPPDLIFLAGYVAFIAIRGRYDSPKRLKRVVVARRDATEMIALVAVGLGIMLAPLVYVVTPLFDGFNYQPHLAIPTAGAILMTLSLILFWRSHADLDRNFSRMLEIREDHVLVTAGVYSRIRHPMYAAIWLYAIAQAMLLANWVAGPAGLAGFAVMYFTRVGREEALMLETFGARYRDYLRNTSRLIPMANRRGRPK